MSMKILENFALTKNVNIATINMIDLFISKLKMSNIFSWALHLHKNNELVLAHVSVWNFLEYFKSHLFHGTIYVWLLRDRIYIY